MGTISKRVFFYSKSSKPFKEVATLVRPSKEAANNYAIQANMTTTSGCTLQNELRFYSSYTQWVRENLPVGRAGLMTHDIVKAKKIDQALFFTRTTPEAYFSLNYKDRQIQYQVGQVHEDMLAGSIDICGTDVLDPSTAFELGIEFEVLVFLEEISDIAIFGYTPDQFGPQPIPVIPDLGDQKLTPWTAESSNLVWEVDEVGGNMLKMRAHL